MLTFELCQGCFLECEMGMQVGLRRFDRFMAEPPSHSAITAQSTPACSSSIAALCLSTCGDTRLDANDGHLSRATRTCLASSDWTLSALSRSPWTFGNNAFAPRRAGSLSHDWRATRACVASGV